MLTKISKKELKRQLDNHEICLRCRIEKELPENMSLARLNDEAKQFFKEHKTRIGNVYCSINNIFIRTFNI